MSITYLVTGGAGFIGSHLVEELLASGFNVRILDNFSTGLESNIEIFSNEELERLEVIRGDIRDLKLLDDAMIGVSGVFHLAALVSVPLSIEKPDLSFDINTRGTHFVLDSARRHGVKRVVMASSAAVYGDNDKLPLKEDEILNPLSPYGLDKSFGEQMGKLYALLYLMNITSLRFFNVFGPRQPPDSSYSGVVSIFAKKAAAKQVATIYGDGEQTRDFVFVKDVVNALKLAMHSSLTGFNVYNVGSGTEIMVKNLWNKFRDISEGTQEAQLLPEREGDIKKSLANISKIENNLGYKPSINFDYYLYVTYEWLGTQKLF